MRTSTICVLSLVLSSCAYSEADYSTNRQEALYTARTYGPDGQEAFSFDCSGASLNWGTCYQKAGRVCGSRGYEVLDKSVGNSAQEDNSREEIPLSAKTNPMSGQIQQYDASQSLNAFMAGRRLAMRRALPKRTMLISCKEEIPAD